MRKLALFVEGETEVAFSERLLSEVANQSDIEIEITTFGGSGSARVLRSVYTPNPSAARFYALIFNCGNDERVLTGIVDRLDALRAGGYELVLGLRDVYPETPTRHSALDRSARATLSQAAIEAEIVFAIREIEAWFIAEWSHFSRIDSRLTRDHIREELDVDVADMNVEDVPHPSKLMGQIYGLAGRRYRKGRFRQRQTLSALDFDEMYLTAPARATALARLIELISGFFLEDA